MICLFEFFAFFLFVVCRSSINALIEEATIKTKHSPTSPTERDSRGTTESQVSGSGVCSLNPTSNAAHTLVSSKIKNFNGFIISTIPFDFF